MSTLFQHQAHPHVPQNVNITHAAAHDTVNDHIAAWLTEHTGTMACAYAFTIIGVVSVVAALTNNTTLALITGAISSYLLQLVFLPVLQAGARVLNRKQELMADEQFQTTSKIYHQLGQLVAHLDAQDAALVALHDQSPPPAAPLTVTVTPLSATETPPDIAAAITKALDERDKVNYRAARRPGKSKLAEVPPPTADAPTEEGKAAA